MTTKRQPTLHSQFIIRESVAKMPGSCRGHYVHVGIIECWGKYTAQLRDTASQRLVWYRGRLNSGKTNRCAAAQAISQARGVAKQLMQAYRDDLSAGYAKHVAERCDEF